MDDETPFDDRTERGTACGDMKVRPSSTRFPVSSAKDVPAIGLSARRDSLPEFIVKSTNTDQSQYKMTPRIFLGKNRTQIIRDIEP